MGAGPMFAVSVETLGVADAKVILKSLERMGCRIAISDEVDDVAGGISIDGVGLEVRFAHKEGNEYIGNDKPNALMIGEYVDYHADLSKELIGKIEAVLALAKLLKAALDGAGMQRKVHAYTCAYTI